MVSNGPTSWRAGWVERGASKPSATPSTGMTPIPDPAVTLPAARFQHGSGCVLLLQEIQLTNKVALEYYQKTMQEAPERIWGFTAAGTYLYTFNLQSP